MEETAPSPVQEPSPPPSGIVLPPSQVVGSSNNSTSPPSISPIPVLEELIPPISALSPFLPSIPPRPQPPSRPRPPSPSHRVAPPIVPPVTCVPSPSPGQEYVNSDDVVAPVEPPQTASPSPSPSWQLYPMPKTPVVDQKPPLFSLPSFPQSNYNKPSSSSVGMIVGISAGVAGVFFILGFILLYFYHRKERNKTIAFEDCESFPRETFYAVEHKPCHKKIPVVPAHVIPATARPFSPNYNSNDDNSPSAHSGSHNPLSPQARVAAFGFSCANFTYEELAMATNDFSSDNLLGEGGFGYVHKGMLSSGRLIAVKQLKEGSQQGEREFQAEVETISRVHHKHLVCLVGYCMSGAKRLLVYEFVPNGTLEFHLHGKGQPVMQWKTRMGIAKGAAKGLAYLHEDCDPTIIHRDIKATNILVDSKFEAKVSDFGLAKIFSDSDHDVTHVSTRVVGTFGYLAPEYALNGKASHKSDVYSFGVMLLELITGKHPIMTAETSMTLVTWAWPLLLQAQEDQNYALLVDPQLQGNYDGEELARMIACAAACVRHSSWLRPRMSLIVRVLEGDTSVCDLSNGSRPGQSSIPSVLNYDFWGVWHGYVSEDIC